MHKPPVFYALIQVKFNPVQMERFVPDFREGLRRDGFPDYEAESQTEVFISMGPNGPKPPEHRPRTRWRFLNMERTEGFTLLDDALVYHTNRYDCFTHCRDAMLQALRVLDEQVDLAYVERIGMRYLDAITPVEDFSLSDLVKPALLGPSADLPGQLEQGFCEVRKTVDSGSLVLRTLINERQLVVPPDLQNQTLNLSEDLSGYQGEIVLMDTDYFVQNRFAFHLDAIEKQFDASHSILIDTFKTAITDKAKKLWKL
ncbi:TIGR04255 family protein [Alcanivorax sp. ZXX171]|nr:TIGR04255 family protein [Alcanivorax sp. ZXX171]